MVTMNKKLNVVRKHLPAYCYSTKLRVDTDLIVYHHLSGINLFRSADGVVDLAKSYDMQECWDILEKINRTDEKGERGYASAHFLIGRDGTIWQLMPLANKAWHAGVSSWRGRSNCNNWSVGIELCGSILDAYTPSQYAALATLSAKLMMIFKLDYSKITGHRFIAPKRKFDPNKGFDWDYMEMALGNINRPWY